MYEGARRNYKFAKEMKDFQGNFNKRIFVNMKDIVDVEDARGECTFIEKVQGDTKTFLSSLL